MNIAGKNALISGGSHGIGLSIAVALAKEGVNIAIFSRTKSRLDEALTILSEYDVECIAVQGDALELDTADKVMKTIDKHWARLDILINNVGGGGTWGQEEPRPQSVRKCRPLAINIALQAKSLFK